MSKTSETTFELRIASADKDLVFAAAKSLGVSASVVMRAGGVAYALAALELGRESEE